MDQAVIHQNEERAGPQRGVSPKILLDQVRNTAPFIFETGKTYPAKHRYLEVLNQTDVEAALSHEKYYELCLAAHHGTVATYVPTDVDNQIRFRLWHPQLDTDTLIRMADIVLESYGWDPTPVTVRAVESEIPGPILCGHIGEWFSTAVGAYGALRKRAPEKAAEIGGEILREVQRHQAIYLDFKKKRDGIGLLKAATVIAHNLGDLDRVIEMWNIADDDALKQSVFKAGHGQGALGEAGALNKTLMAHENHRHFALRKPRCLRRNAEFLLPIAPFLDAWGARIAHHPGLALEEIAEIAEALFDGHAWLAKNARQNKAPLPHAYIRALSGLVENFRGGFSALAARLPARVARELKSGELRQAMSMPQRRFEEQQAKAALHFIKA